MRAHHRSLIQGSAFVPNNISGLVLWYDATKITGLTNGATVSSWPDLSGGNHTLTTVSGIPTYQVSGINSHSAVSFSGVQMTTVSGLPIALPLTYCAVLSVTSSIINQGFWQANAGGTHTNCYGDGSVSQYGIGEFNGSTIQIRGGTVDTNPHMLIFVMNGVSSVINLDGTQVASGNGGSDPPGTGSFLLGQGQLPGGSASFSGVLGELFVYNIALNITQQSQIHSYFSSKWGTP